MKFGVILPNYGEGATRLALTDTTVAAEKLGYDSVWATDHLALPVEGAGSFGYLFESISTLAYLAGSSREIKLGLSALVLPQRNPLEVAKTLSTLDVLSNGRLILGTGIGWSSGEYNNLGMDFNNRGKRMSEAVQVLRTCWRGNRQVSFKGKYYQFENVSFSPLPLQPGGPPIWLAGNSIHALKRAVNLADGWHPNAFDPSVMKSMLDEVQPLIDKRPFKIAVRFRLDFQAASAETKMLSGSPKEVIFQLKAYEKIGVQYALINFMSDSQAARERSMRIFMEEVAPAFATN